ncbi:ATP-grasp domain-containing protein [Natrarchaeobaculum aegyptiacum]|uniref:Carboxylate--amine ligase n=1 Tax=Natrarchaeobaculum aegyptiacum TaxID=745377 RepID=A0A2Z2HV29_9EURY|nr:ATP-grasp domain-containing protein [Natrarchaeobaculum aegyptiacum]ARS91129.1 carboxylate--amine ligase [Natrarchaeobaculum aegyptiacum]
MDGPRQGVDGKVVVPAIDAASSVACMRSLGRRGIETIAISEQRSPPGFRSRYVDETVRVPDPALDLEAYEDAILELARREDVCTIIPVREADIYVLARNVESLESEIATAWPTLPQLRTVQDRVRLFDAASEAGVASPETKPFDEWASWDDDSIVKPRYTVHTPEYAPAFDTRQTNPFSTRYIPAGHAPDRSRLVDRMGHVPIVQEYVPDSDEYAFFALYRDGEAVATFQHRQRRGWKYAGGPSAYRESVDIPELYDAGHALLDHLEWHGLAMVEFLRDPETGEFKLMEVNPRFWTSLPFTVRAGVDFPYLYWLQATGRELPDPPDYDIGLGGHLLRGELLHLHSILYEEYPVVDRPKLSRTILEMALTLALHPRFDYLDPDDFGPFVQDSRNAARQLLAGADDPPAGDQTLEEPPTASSRQLTSITETIKSTIERF